MYLGNVLLESENESILPELCILPEKPGALASAIPIRKLVSTKAALFYVSYEEAFNVTIEEEDGSINIAPYRPAKLYLTPNRPEKPGFAVSRIKVYYSPDGASRVFFDREKGWEEYTPNIKEY